jgi:hypothetical protein
VVINYLNVKRVPSAPNETDAILIIDADTCVALSDRASKLQADFLERL